MSLILKGIDLPTEGELTFIAVCNDGRAYKMAMPPTGVLRLGPYADLYQAIQIPKGHGRLIDGGWVKYNLENYSDLPTKYLHMDLVREAIDDAPTILEAEE